MRVCVRLSMWLRCADAPPARRARKYTSLVEYINSYDMLSFQIRHSAPECGDTSGRARGGRAARVRGRTPFGGIRNRGAAPNRPTEGNRKAGIDVQ